MTTLYLLGGLILSVAGGAWLAYRAGLAAGRGEMAVELGRMRVERDAAMAARDAAARVADAALNGPRTSDDALSRLNQGNA